MNKYIRRFIFITIILSIFSSSCREKIDIDINAYKNEFEQWQIKRAESLKKENGWLTLCGLFWLKEGENKFGTDSSNTIIFPPGRSPAYAGSIFLKNNQLSLKCAKNVTVFCNDSAVSEMKIKSDETGKASPTVMKLGSLSFHVIKRGEELGVRVRDKENPPRVNFKGLEYFPIDPEWRIEATFVPYNPPKIIPIVNVLNQVKNDTCPGAIVFKKDRNTYRLDALRDEKELFIIFHDETAGKETYAMGRFLMAPLPDSNNIVILDFNKAYNPPCAFTEFATCPLPPKQNHLSLRIEAGEKKDVGRGH
ncbi:MAG: DUF1684 domain-containing protein [Bacteroidota bacterium]|nr:DUF1684 domain-containing protein [Bacteroidota bacterium]